MHVCVYMLCEQFFVPALMFLLPDIEVLLLNHPLPSVSPSSPTTFSSSSSSPSSLLICTQGKDSVMPGEDAQPHVLSRSLDPSL